MQQGKLTAEKTEEYCLLVGVISSDITEEIAIEHIDELEFLAETAGAITKHRILQKLPFPNPKTKVGTGK